MTASELLLAAGWDGVRDCWWVCACAEVREGVLSHGLLFFRIARREQSATLGMRKRDRVLLVG